MASSALRALNSRTVHVKIYPTARTFAERTEVLRVLEGFGPVDYFKSLKHIAVPDAFVTIFNQAAAAEKIINSSPIRYRIVPEPVPHPSAINPTVIYAGPIDERPTELRAMEAIEEADRAANTRDQPEEEERIFELRLSHSVYPHRKFIERGLLYGSWNPVSTMASPIASDLVGRIPSETILSGLRDWETGGLGGVSDFASNVIDERTDQRPFRVVEMMRKRDAAENPKVIRRLWPLYEQALKEHDARIQEKGSEEDQNPLD